MVAQTCIFHGSPDVDSGPASTTPGVVLGDPFQGSLADQTLWLISLRWIAVTLVVIGTLVGTYAFPVLMDPRPLYATALVLLMCNIAYAVATHGRRDNQPRSAVTLATVQMEVDLLVLTAALHFSGGVTNPFCLFYVFHVIIATIILPRSLSFAVGLTAITLFGLLAANELNAGAILGHYPLQLSAGGGFWRNPVYSLAAFAAFACTVMIAQYLTRIIIVRMASKELEAAQNSNLLRAIINAMAEGLIFITAEGQVALCNRAAGQWRLNSSGADPESVDAFPATLAEHIKALANREHERPTLEKTIEFHTGGPTPRLIEARSCPVTELQGAPLGYVIVGQDLTEHRRLEADLLSHTEQVTTIDEMVHNTLELIRLDKRAAGVTITDMYNAELPRVWLNPQNLEQCLLNIAINALDAMEAKGAGFDHRLEVVETLREEKVEIRISYNLITEMEGTIELQSELGKGTTAIIRIPVRPKKDLLVGPPGETGHAHGTGQTE